MIAGIECSGCGRSVPERRLRVQVLTVESCPHCGEIVRRSDRIRWTDEDAALQQDVAAIDGWVDALCRGNGLTAARDDAGVGAGRWRWEISGATSWGCEAVYEIDRPGFVGLRLFSAAHAAAVAADPRRLLSACASRGVELYCLREPPGRWGAQQHLAVEALHEAAFWPILRRLTEAMYEAVLEFADQGRQE
jgi:predicted RNA-binding Zn-ribbon protein involved in translation (DUF1610 family)